MYFLIKEICIILRESIHKSNSICQERLIASSKKNEICQSNDNYMFNYVILNWNIHFSCFGIRLHLINLYLCLVEISYTEKNFRKSIEYIYKLQ